VQEQKLRSEATKSRLGGAKSVTNNLPILSVLGLDLFVSVQIKFRPV